MTSCARSVGEFLIATKKSCQCSWSMLLLHLLHGCCSQMAFERLTLPRRRTITLRVWRTRSFLSYACRMKFVVDVLFQGDDGDDEDEPPPLDNNAPQPPCRLPTVHFVCALKVLSALGESSACYARHYESEDALCRQDGSEVLKVCCTLLSWRSTAWC